MTQRNRSRPADPSEGPTLHIDDDLLLQALASVERHSGSEAASGRGEDGEDPEIPIDVDHHRGGAGGEISIDSLDDELIVDLEPIEPGPSAPQAPGFLFEVPEDLLDADVDPDLTDPRGFTPAPPQPPPEPPSEAPAPPSAKSLLSDPMVLDRVSRMRKRIKKLQRRVSELEGELDQERQSAQLARSRARIAENSRIEADEQRDNIDRFARSLRQRVMAQEEELARLKKRSSTELERARMFGADNTIREILPVLDNLELAISHADTDPEKFVPGVKMVTSQFLRSLERIGVNPIDATPGTPFDPSIHEAILTMPSSEHPEGTVAEQVRSGYTLHERLLRASQVTVAGPPMRPREAIVPPASDDAIPASDPPSSEE